MKETYLGYTYRGKIKIKHGIIDVTKDLPYPTVYFISDDGTRHTQLPFRPYYMYYGRVWGDDKDKIKDIIRKRFEDRIKELENSNALAYAEMIVEEE